MTDGSTDGLTDLEVRDELEILTLKYSSRLDEIDKLRKQLERVRQTVLMAFDDGWFASNAGRNWDGTHAWNASRAKVRLENEGLSTEMPKEEEVAKEEVICDIRLRPSKPLDTWTIKTQRKYVPLSNEEILAWAYVKTDMARDLVLPDHGIRLVQSVIIVIENVELLPDSSMTFLAACVDKLSVSV